jgi:pimeloyl-ACP methyl ester carboxylesterase
VHGISHNALEHATLFASYAEAYGVVLVAPLFEGERFRDYQRLGRAGRGARSDAALDAIVDEVGSLTGASTTKIYIFGFSGGAQFTHRYTMAHPQQVARAVVGSAGWYTFPDSTVPYPHGLGPHPDLPGVHFDPEQFLRVPIAVFVGDRDSTSASMRHDETVDTQQGVTRFDRARNWAEAMRAAASARKLEPQVSYEMVPGIHHSFKQFMEEGRLGDRTFIALFGSPAPKPSDPATVGGGRSGP